MLTFGCHASSEKLHVPSRGELSPLSSVLGCRALCQPLPYRRGGRRAQRSQQRGEKLTSRCGRAACSIGIATLLLLSWQIKLMPLIPYHSFSSHSLLLHAVEFPAGHEKRVQAAPSDSGCEIMNMVWPSPNPKGSCRGRRY